MRWIYNDGGRAEAGFKGKAGDCAARAIAIAAEIGAKGNETRLLERLQAQTGDGKEISARQHPG